MPLHKVGNATAFRYDNKLVGTNFTPLLSGGLTNIILYGITVHDGKKG
jgi:hypothetical protein